MIANSLETHPAPQPPPAGATALPASATPLPSGATPLPSGATPLPSGATPLPSGATPPAAPRPAEGGALRVLIVAGDPLARAGLAALLAATPAVRVVGQASDRDDARTALAAFRPDAVLLGLGWDTEDLDALSAFTDAGALVVALLGSEADRAALAAVWLAGPRAVLGRSADGQQVAAALAAVVQGLAIFDPQHANLPPVGVAPSSPLAEPVEALTARESQVLQGMADGLSNKLIARELGISEHTVKYHVNAILGKLQAQSRTEAVVRATRAGLLHL